MNSKNLSLVMNPSPPLPYEQLESHIFVGEDEPIRGVIHFSFPERNRRNENTVYVVDLVLI